MLPLKRGSPWGASQGGALADFPAFNIMYVVTPNDPIYHVAFNQHLTVCMLHLSIDPEHRKRGTDKRLVAEKPTSRLTMLCQKCEKIAAEKNLEGSNY
jgi:hypothetical protein